MNIKHYLLTKIVLFFTLNKLISALYKLNLDIKVIQLYFNELLKVYCQVGNRDVNTVSRTLSNWKSCLRGR